MSVAVILPALNEEERIGRVLAAIPTGVTDEIIVVYGGSSDSAVAIAQAGGIPPRILPALEDERFLETFRRKGCMSDLLAHMPVHVTLNPKIALLGREIIMKGENHEQLGKDRCHKVHQCGNASGIDGSFVAVSVGLPVV